MKRLLVDKKFGVFLLTVALITAMAIGCTSKVVQESGTVDGTIEENGFPKQPIKMIVPWSPGGTSDMQAQLMAHHLEKELGVSVVVECIPGASGVLGVMTAKHLPADGYTILMTDGVGFVMRSFLEGGYSVDEFIPLGADVRDVQSIIVRADSPYKDLRDIINEMKGKPNKIKVGAIGPVAPRIQLVLELEEMFEVNANAIPYKGESDVLAALLGGHIDAAIHPIANLADAIEDGEIRALAVGWDERLQEFSDIPTIGEVSGIDTQNASVRGYYVKKGTPQYIIDILDAARKKAAMKQEYIDSINKIAPYYFMSREDFEQFLKAQESLIGNWVTVMQTRFE